MFANIVSNLLLLSQFVVRYWPNTVRSEIRFDVRMCMVLCRGVEACFLTQRSTLWVNVSLNRVCACGFAVLCRDNSRLCPRLITSLIDTSYSVNSRYVASDALRKSRTSKPKRVDAVNGYCINQMWLNRLISAYTKYNRQSAHYNPRLLCCFTTALTRSRTAIRCLTAVSSHSEKPYTVYYRDIRTVSLTAMRRLTAVSNNNLFDVRLIAMLTRSLNNVSRFNRGVKSRYNKYTRDLFLLSRPKPVVQTTSKLF